MQPIGVVRSCFRERFGVPRQSGLVPEARATVELSADYARREAVRGLEGFSHIWIVFVFHERGAGPWRATVRPPRLGGQRRVGVFASRSPHRPNPVGMSAVELLGIELGDRAVRLRVGGVDLLDGTPVLDLKPYLPYTDAVAGARPGYAPQAPQAPLEVVFTEPALAELRARGQDQAGELRALIVRLLGADPRPAYFGGREHGRDTFGMRLFDFDLRWRVEGSRVVVTALAAPEAAAER